MQASALPPLGSSDHVTIQGSWPIPRQVPKSQQRNKSEPQIFWSWEKADISSLRDAIEKEDWSDIHLCQDVNKAWIRWKAKIMCLATRFIPHHTKPKNQQGIFQSRPWVTDEIKHQVKEKHRLFRRFKASRLDDDWENLKSSEIVYQQFCALQSRHLCLDFLKIIVIEISLDYTNFSAAC